MSFFYIRLETRLAADPAIASASPIDLGCYFKIAMYAANSAEPGRLNVNGRPLSTRALAELLHIPEADAEAVITALSNLGLIVKADDALEVPWVLKGVEEAETLAEIASRAGKESARVRRENRARKTDAQRPLNARSSTVQPKSNRIESNHIEQQHRPAEPGNAAAGDAAGEEPDTPAPPSPHPPPPTDRTPPPPTPPAEPPPQRHDDADADAAGQAELSPVVIALMGFGVEQATAERLARYPWVTLDVVKKRIRGMREGQGPGLLITQLERDERQMWEAEKQKRDEAERTKAAEQTRRREEAEALIAKAHQHAAEDDELLAEATPEELGWAAKNPDSATRYAIREGPKDAAGLPLDRILRHQLAEGVRGKRGLERIKATMKPPPSPPPAPTLKLAG